MGWSLSGKVLLCMLFCASSLIECRGRYSNDTHKITYVSVSTRLQSREKVFVRGLVKYNPAVAYHFASTSLQYSRNHIQRIFLTSVQIQQTMDLIRLLQAPRSLSIMRHRRYTGTLFSFRRVVGQHDYLITALWYQIMYTF